MSDPALTTDPVSGQPVRRIITGGAGLLLGKGNGAAESSCGMGACNTAPISGPCCGGGCRGH